MHTFWLKAGRWQNVLSLANMLHYFISSSYELPAALPAAFSLLYIIRQKGVFNKMNKPNENGRSMIEMLGVLAIIGVLSVGGIAGYSKAMETYKINTIKSQVAQLITNIHTLYIQQNSYDGLNTESAVNMGLFSDGFDTQNLNDTSTSFSAARNKFNTEFSVQGWGSYFNIAVANINKEECVALATTDWGNYGTTGIRGLGISLDYISMQPTPPGSPDDCNKDICEDHAEGYLYGLYSNKPTKLIIPPATAAKMCEEILLDRGNLTFGLTLD